MTNSYALRLPDDPMRAAREAAKRNSTSLNQFLLSAIAERVRADRTVALLERYAGRADMTAFQGAMAGVPDAPPVPGDELEAEPADDRPRG